MIKTKTIITLFLLSYFHLGFSQRDSIPDILIHYANDTSIVLAGYKILKSTYDSTEIISTSTSNDTLTRFYNMYPFFNFDSNYSIIAKKHISMDSINFSKLIIQSNLILNLEKHGYGIPISYDDLIIKYGVEYYPAGCIVYPQSEIEIEYYSYINKLLAIRNGKNWQKEYNQEIQNRNRIQEKAIKKKKKS
jgi:hypothetical protein